MAIHGIQTTNTLPKLSDRIIRRRTVHEFPDTLGGPSGTLIFQIASAADEAPIWWNPARDSYLDKFWPTEPFLSGTIFSIASRNAGFRYEFTGPAEQVTWSQQLLAQADFGRGWQSFIMKVTLDLLTMDNGAFIEIIRPARARTKTRLYDAIKHLHPETDEYVWHAYDRHTGEVYSPDALDFKVTDSVLDLPIGLAHLDSRRCTRTGNPTYPVVYTDLTGNQHKLAEHQVITLEEMPSPREEWYNVQHSFVTRALRLAQILRDMLIYKHEKVSGRFARAIQLTNIDPRVIQDAIDQSNATADTKGLTRYMQPIVAATIDPNSKPGVETIELASMPAGFDEETAMRWYIAGLALTGGVDYGFLAPLPGNKLGTGMQVETQERQARGKSSRLFLNTLQYVFNYSGILPRNVTLRFAIADPYEESEKDRALARRARARSTQIKSGEITPEIATQIAADVGDIDPKYLPMMGLADLTPIITVGGNEPVQKVAHYIPRQLPLPSMSEETPVTDGEEQP